MRVEPGMVQQETFWFRHAMAQIILDNRQCTLEAVDLFQICLE